MGIARIIKGAACFIAGAALGLALFAPLDQAAAWMAARVSNDLSFPGIRTEINGVSAEGAFDPCFTFSGIKAGSPFAFIRISWIQADPSILKTITSGKLRTHINTGGGLISGGLNGILSWRSASCDATIGDRSVILDDIMTDGDLKARGYIELSKQGKIIGADMSVSVPDKFDGMIKAAAIVGALPVKNIAPGEWRFRK